MTLIRLAALAASLLVAPVAGATTAQAVPADPTPPLRQVSVEIDDSAAPVAAGTVSAFADTKLSSGVLSFWAQRGSQAGGSYYSMNAGISYKKDKGGKINARFFYEEGGNKHWDQGAFEQKAGETKNYGWGGAALPKNCSAVGGMEVTGQGTFLTPPEHPC
ncbi:hypothetical protein ACFWXO_25775 [Kitasatospora sp. NPDC059088]|uniref:hypothetical protein n=1 Tax=Kitasatospora sp. NPDC059088 TaxID=3346722 RepID=UPI0036CC8E84